MNHLGDDQDGFLAALRTHRGARAGIRAAVVHPSRLGARKPDLARYLLARSGPEIDRAGGGALRERNRAFFAGVRDWLAPHVTRTAALPTYEEFVAGCRECSLRHHLRGAEAVEAGLANELVDHDGLLPAALRWCERVTRPPDHVPVMTKTVVRQAADLSWEQAIAMEEFAEPMCFTTEGHRAGVAALR